MNHFINQCKICDKVISQCRCAGNKTVNKDFTCKNCEQLNFIITEMVYPYADELTRILSEANRENLLKNIKITISAPTINANITGTIAGVKFEIIKDNQE